jgi:hypothetical protein
MMRKLYALGIVLFAAFLLFGCMGMDSWGSGGSGVSPGKTGYDSYPVSAAPGGAVSESGSYAPSPSVPNQADRMVIKTGNANVEVPQGTLEERNTKLRAMVASYGGEVTDSSYTETENEKYYYVTAKLDPASFDSFGKKLSELGTVKSLSSNSEDVTTQYIDISAKLDNLKASRDRIMALYNRTNNISEILQLEQEINRLQYEIDSTTQQKLYYERQAAKATMTIQLVEPAPVVDTTLLNPFSQLVNVFIAGLAFGMTLIAGIAGFGLPVIAVLAVLGIVVKLAFFSKPKPKEEKKK